VISNKQSAIKYSVMKRTSLIIGLLLIEMLFNGCATTPWTTGKKEVSPPANLTPDKPTSATSSASNTNGQNPPSASNPQANAQAMQEIVEELRQLGTIDPAAQNKLMDDLKQTDPALWPLVMKQFRAAIAYKRRMNENEITAVNSNPPASNPEKINPVSNPAASTVASNYIVPSVMSADTPHSSAQPAVLADNQSAQPINKTPYSKDASTATDSNVNKAQQAKYQPASDQSQPPQAVQQLADVRPVSENVNLVGYTSSTTTNSSELAGWREQLSATIQTMEGSASTDPKTSEELAQQARLRILYVLAGRRDDALKPIPTAPPAVQDFWSKELYGLSTLLDSQRTPDNTRRAAESKQILSEAVSRLGETAPLIVRNMAFCTAIQSYGCFTPFKKYEFAPDQEVLLYAEMDNFVAESTAKGYHTQLRSSYQILDTTGQRIADHTFTTTEEYCQNPRHDFFIGFHLRMPRHINPGKYNLQLTIEDLKSQKIGQSMIELTIKDADK
jgi:hypothetical protein